MQDSNVFLLAIQEFCKANNLDYEKIKASPRCWNDNVLFIQRANDTSPSAGLLDESPAEIILSARKGADGIIIGGHYEADSKH